MFERDISPVLTPLSLDAAHPFPYVSNLSTSWAFQLEDPVTGEAVLVRVKLPTDLPQWLRLKAVDSSEWVFVGLDQVIRANAEAAVSGNARGQRQRVARDADVELDENDGLSKRAMVEEELRQRRFEPVVRLEVQPDADPAMVAELVDRFALALDAVYEMSALLDYTTLFEIAGLDVPELRDPPWTPLAPRVLEAAPDSDIFSAIRSADILLHPDDPCNRHHIPRQIITARPVAPQHHHRLRHPRTAQQHRLDLPQLHPLTPQLHLKIGTPQILQLPGPAPPTPDHPSDTSAPATAATERIRHKPIRRQITPTHDTPAPTAHRPDTTPPPPPPAPAATAHPTRTPACSTPAPRSAPPPCPRR